MTIKLDSISMIPNKWASSDDKKINLFSYSNITGLHPRSITSNPTFTCVVPEGYLSIRCVHLMFLSCFLVYYFYDYASKMALPSAAM